MGRTLSSLDVIPRCESGMADKAVRRTARRRSKRQRPRETQQKLTRELIRNAMKLVWPAGRRTRRDTVAQSRKAAAALARSMLVMHAVRPMRVEPAGQARFERAPAAARHDPHGRAHQQHDARSEQISNDCFPHGSLLSATPQCIRFFILGHSAAHGKRRRLNAAATFSQGFHIFVVGSAQPAPYLRRNRLTHAFR